MKIINIVAVALNTLLLLTIMFFVLTQGVGSYDVIGFTVLSLLVTTPIVNIFVLLYGKLK